MYISSKCNYNLDELDLPGGNTETFSALSKDGGDTFATSINVSETNTLSFNQQIAMSGDNAVITWTERFFGGPDDEIFAALNKDGGDTFATPINVSETEASSFGSQIAMSGDNVVIIWGEDFPGSNSEIFVAMSSDGGSTFETPINVSNTNGFSGTPQVATYYDNVVITWREVLPGDQFETFVAMSSDGGSTFGNPINVSNTTTSSQRPQIAMSGDNVVITWREILPESNSEILAAMSFDGGSTFGNPINVSNTDTVSRNQQVVMYGDNVVITWQDDIPGNDEIFAVTSFDGGSTFGNPINVSNTDTSSSFPQIAMFDDIVVITWMDDVSGFNFEIFSAASTDGGSTFETAFNVSNTDVDSTFPQVSIG